VSNKKYRIFASPDYDHFVAAHREKWGRIRVLYAGDSQERAYEAILEDLDSLPETEVREMPSGSYAPKKSDWATPKVDNEPNPMSYRHICRICLKPVAVIERNGKKGAEAIHVSDLNKLDRSAYKLREVSVSHWNKVKGKLEDACRARQKVTF
jgi:hypothetical protein